MDPRITMIQGTNPADEQQIIAALDTPTIRVVLPAGTPTLPHQLLAIALVDLLGRVFPRIDASCDADTPADPALPPGAPVLAERLQAARENGHGPAQPAEATVTIAVGHTEEPADLHVDGAAWQSYLGTEPSRLPAQKSSVPVGVLLAGARAAAHASKLLLGDLLPSDPPPESEYFCALRYVTAGDPLDFPVLPAPGTLHAVLVGQGSVGGAACYLLARTCGLAGELALVDGQALEERNYVRAILATRAAARAQEPKAHVAANALAHLALDVGPHQATIADYVAGRPRTATLPLVLCAVDSPQSRRSIQDCLPLELINAACSRSEIMISGHRTDDGPCVCCLQMAETLDGQNIRARLIAQATGLNFDQVIMWMIKRVELDAQAIRFIEQRTSRPTGSLATYVGKTLDQLWEQQLLYGEVDVTAAGGAHGAVAAPWVTALAGFLLGAEALKAAGGEPSAEHRLGPARVPAASHYAEAVYAAPSEALLTAPARWPGTECLCGSPRRLRLLRTRYGLAA